METKGFTVCRISYFRNIIKNLDLLRIFVFLSNILENGAVLAVGTKMDTCIGYMWVVEVQNYFTEMFVELFDYLGKIMGKP